jgi:hypothetical protein
LIAKVSGEKVHGIDTKKIDTTAIIFAMKTRFFEDYGNKDKIALEHSGSVNLSNDLRQLINDKLNENPEKSGDS